MKRNGEQSAANSLYPDLVDDETEGLTGQRSHLQTVLRRAALVYLMLFMGLGLVMSLLGVNPLVNHGLMPKLLLVFVGLALVITWANTLTDLLREQSRNWLRLGRGRAVPAKKTDE